MHLNGGSIKRREDRRFLTGRGEYLDDIFFDDEYCAIFVRSPHPHAKIKKIKTEAALTVPDVVSILSAEDVENDGLRAMQPFITSNPNTKHPFNFIPQPLLAKKLVRYVGEPILLVLAKSMYAALDAIQLIEVDYDVLPFVLSAQEALKEDSPLIAEALGTNLCLNWRSSNSENMDVIFSQAKHVIELNINNNRIVSNPMEPRGVIALWDHDTNKYTIYASSQNIHVMRDTVANMLNVDRNSVRFKAFDVGGGFGSKNFCYPEYALIAWAAKKVDRPVRWIATRSELFISDHQARDHNSVSRLAIADDGKFIALEINSVANLGAYMVGSSGGVQVVQYANLPGTVYKIPSICLNISAAFTNKTPTGVFRGPGYAETNLILERLIDAAALKHNFDRLELRQKNFIDKGDTPFTDVLGGSIDSGDFSGAFEQLMTRIDLAGFEERKNESKKRGFLRGLGVACFIKGTGGAPTENVELRFISGSRIDLVTGTQSIGQGHETTFPQILAKYFGVSGDVINLKQADTDLIETGGEHGSSRATYMGGSALHYAAAEVIKKGKQLAANVLEVAVEDILFENGRFIVDGTDREVGLFELAALAEKNGSSLNTYNLWERQAMTFPNGVHAAELEVDSETGKVKLNRYLVVDDYGVIINPLLVEGQVHGAVTNGIGQALLEGVMFDPESGQTLTGSFMDYSVARADDLLDYQIEFKSTTCATNPLGVKGCGEGGTVAATPAVMNAIVDALSEYGVSHLDGPVTSSKIWKLLKGCQK